MQITGEYERVFNPWQKYWQMIISFCMLFLFMGATIVAMLSVTVIRSVTLKNTGFFGILLSALINFAVIEVLTPTLTLGLPLNHTLIILDQTSHRRSNAKTHAAVSLDSVSTLGAVVEIQRIDAADYACSSAVC